MPSLTGGPVLELLPLPGGGGRLVRLYGESPCAALPEALPAPPGAEAPDGLLRLTELGDYCFSEAPRGLPAPERLCRYALDEAGAPRLCAAPGGAAEGGGPTLPPAVCGSFLEELRLPDTLRVIGSCAFYNCRRLRRLSAGPGPLTLGSDVFLNCFALETIRLRAQPGQATGLFALVNSIPETVQALFWPQDAAAPQAGLWYPAYWEDVEESPAHILLHTFSGQGYHYRQCFREGRAAFDEYDAIFPQGHAAEDPAVMAMLCFDRLRWPCQLDADAHAAYRAFLAAHSAPVLARLFRAQDLDALRALLALALLDADALAAGAAEAARAENAAASALLAEAERALRAAEPKKERYAFDF